MQAEGGSGTTVERGWAVSHLCQAVPGCDAERLLYLATSATLLDADEGSVRFYHQLLQEYFAAREMERRVAAGERLEAYWPGGRWWEPSSWEETAILLAAMQDDASSLLAELAAVHPILAVRCLLEGGAQAGEETRQGIFQALVAAMAENLIPPVDRSRAGDALARLGDLRPGVGLDPETGLPDIAWCEVPAGSFLMGSDEKDGLAYDREKPQHEVLIGYVYHMAKYPVTNLQYASFVRAQGYQKRRYWTDAGWQWKGDRMGPETYGGALDLPSHPVVMVRWYEVAAFCRWLTEWFRETGDLGEDEEVRLPTEAEWEKAARSTDGRIYPWGNEFDANRCNMRDTGIDTTSAVGAFPGGASPYGVEDLSGNVWEWCGTKWRDSYEEGADESLKGDGRRVLRGGSFYNDQRYVRCAFRDVNFPYYGSRSRGFRVVVAPVQF
jgi:formylglycine-generating enzyme required for sulfatase activity